MKWAHAKATIALVDCAVARCVPGGVYHEQSDRRACQFQACETADGELGDLCDYSS